MPFSIVASFLLPLMVLSIVPLVDAAGTVEFEREVFYCKNNFPNTPQSEYRQLRCKTPDGLTKAGPHQAKCRLVLKDKESETPGRVGPVDDQGCVTVFRRMAFYIDEHIQYNLCRNNWPKTCNPLSMARKQKLRSNNSSQNNAFCAVWRARMRPSGFTARLNKTTRLASRDSATGFALDFGVRKLPIDK